MTAYKTVADGVCAELAEFRALLAKTAGRIGDLADDAASGIDAIDRGVQHVLMTLIREPLP